MHKILVVTSTIHLAKGWRGPTPRIRVSCYELSETRTDRVPCPMQIVSTLDPIGLDLLSHMLRYEPSRRITARAALTHKYFADIDQLYKANMPLS